MTVIPLLAILALVWVQGTVRDRVEDNSHKKKEAERILTYSGWINYTAAITDWDAWEQTLQPEQRERLNQRFKFSTPDSLQHDRQRFLAVGYVAEKTGIPVQDVSRGFDIDIRDTFASSPQGLGLGRPVKDTAEFLGVMKMKVQNDGRSTEESARQLAETRSFWKAYFAKHTFSSP